MYAEHVPIINAGMRHSPEIFARGVTFAFLSMRTQFVRLNEQMAQVDAVGHSAQALWGHKRGAYLHLRKHCHALFHSVSACSNPVDGILLLCSIPGLGIVKSAFVLQMMGHDIGCLDTRNNARLGIHPREYRTDGVKTGPAFKRKVERYVTTTDGQAQSLWDAWCEDVAGVYKTTAEDISRDHLIIVPSRYRNLPREAVPCYTSLRSTFEKSIALNAATVKALM